MDRKTPQEYRPEACWLRWATLRISGGEDTKERTVNKLFQGARTIDGIRVTVDGRALDDRQALWRFTDRGFEWGYAGVSPQQLALAILHEHLGDPVRALDLCERFMHEVVAGFDNEWKLGTQDIDEKLQDLS